MWIDQTVIRVLIHAVARCAMAVAFCGCMPKKPPIVVGPPLSFREAAEVVNENAAKIEGTLRASGDVDGHYATESGRRRSYHLDGVLFFLHPRSLRFDLQKFGETKVLLGSNAEWYWCYTREDDRYTCGQHGQPPPDDVPLPARPDQLLDALGLSPIPVHASDVGTGLVSHRVVNEFQQILYFDAVGDGTSILRKECWLDRSGDRLVRRVLFRDDEGIVEMVSELEEYRAWAPNGPKLPHLLTFIWPRFGAELRFHVSEWKLVPQVEPGSIQFRTPKACTSGTS